MAYATTRYCLSNPVPEPTPADGTILHFVPDADCEHFVEFSQDCSSYLPLKRYHDETQLIDYVGPGVIRKDVPVMITYVSALGYYVLGSLPDNNQFAGWHTSGIPVDIGPGSAKRHYKSFGLRIDIDFNGIPRKEAVQEIYNGSFDGDIVIKFATTLSGITTIYRDTVITSDMTLKSGSRVKLVANGDDQWVMVDRTPDDTAIGAVLSVFSRTGHVTAQFSDYAIFYAPLTHVGSRDLVTGHPLATPALDGFMSAADKTTTDKAVTADAVLGADERVLVADGAVRGAKTVPVTIDADGNIDLVKTLGYLTNLTTKPPWKEGVSFYDENDKCEVVYNEVAAVTQQGGREIFIRGYNNGLEIADGKPVSVVGTDPDGWPYLAITDASDKLNALAYIGVSTHDIPNGTFGYVSITGAIRGLDTSLLIENAPLWVDPATPGGYIQARPHSPAWEVRVGGVSKSDPLEGIIYSRPRVENNTQDAGDFFNGAMLPSPVVTAGSDGATVTCEVENPAGGDLSLMFFAEFVTPTAPYIVTLTAGTDSVPVRNWVYFPESTQLLTVSLTGFPTTEQFAPVADIMVQSPASVALDGFYKVHAWTDHFSNSVDQGHLSDVNAWIRAQPSVWKSGVVITPTPAAGSSAVAVDISLTSGVVLQLHSHTFDSFDSSAGDSFFVINDPDAAYTKIGNLNTVDLDKDSTGASLANKYYNLVLWGVISEDLEDCQVYINLPDSFYTTATGALADANGTANYTIPTEYAGTGFLISRLVMRNQGANIQIITGGVFDLRGTFPTASGGGVSGGAGVTLWTQLLDTPNAWAGFAGYGTRVNAGETGLEFVTPALLADGSIPLTAPWDVGGFDITGVGDLTVDNIDMSTEASPEIIFDADAFETFGKLYYYNNQLGLNGWIYELNGSPRFVIGNSGIDCLSTRLKATYIDDVVEMQVGTTSFPEPFGMWQQSDDQNIQFSGGLGPGGGANMILNGGTASPASATQFFAGAVETMRLDSSGNVGIGTTTPAIKLEVVTSSTGRAWNPTAVTAALFERNLANSIEIVSGAASYGAVEFGDTNASQRGSVRYDHATNALYFRVAGFEKVRMPASGGLQLGGTSGPSWTSGTGTPEGSKSAPVGSMYSRTDGGAGTSFYVKESGTGNTGWVAK